MKRIHIECSQCGITFKRYPSLIKNNTHYFCTRSCFDKWKSENWRGEKAPGWQGGKKRSIKCSQCGKSFQRYANSSNIQQPQNEFCSKDCYSKWQSKNTKGQLASNWQGGSITVKCKTCDKELQRIKSELKKHEHFFCDKKCYGKWKSQTQSGENHPMWKGNQISVICANCGQDFNLPNWHGKRSGNKFCNGKCYGEWASLNLTGDKRYNWKGGRIPYYGPNWQTQCKKVRQRDHYKCQHCGAIENGQSHDVHHIKPLREFNYIPDQNDNYILANDLTNLICLCRSCHRVAE